MAKATEHKASTPSAPEVTKAGDSARNGSHAQVPVKWTTTNLTSSYANFCNANSTREEVVPAAV